MIEMDVCYAENNNNNPHMNFDAKKVSREGDESSSEVNNNDIATTSTDDQMVIDTRPDDITNAEEVEDACTYEDPNRAIRIRVTDSEQWLCLARIPTHFNEARIRELAEQFGDLEQLLLIQSQRTGQFKGYALLLFSSKVASLQARHVLDGHDVILEDGHPHRLECDWLKKHSDKVVSLHSKCLYVDNLPNDFRDLCEFRRMFSVVVSPPYCQIAMKNGVIQNWGLVEFKTAEEAEETLERLRGAEIRGKKLRVQYCIPGTHAINIYMSFINDPMNAVNERRALLEETPPTEVYNQLESLAKQNPWFVQSLQNIMAANNGSRTCNTSTQILPSQPPPAGCDPAQAALVLLLAGKLTTGNATQAQNAELMQETIKQLEGGAKASDILKKLAFNDEGNGDDLGSIITTLAKSAHEMLTSAKGNTPRTTCYPVRTDPNKKDPLLTELICKSFQARIKNGVYKKPSASSVSDKNNKTTSAHDPKQLKTAKATNIANSSPISQVVASTSTFQQPGLPLLAASLVQPAQPTTQHFTTGIQLTSPYTPYPQSLYDPSSVSGYYPVMPTQNISAAAAAAAAQAAAEVQYLQEQAALSSLGNFSASATWSPITADASQAMQPTHTDLLFQQFFNPCLQNLAGATQFQAGTKRKLDTTMTSYFDGSSLTSFTQPQLQQQQHPSVAKKMKLADASSILGSVVMQ